MSDAERFDAMGCHDERRRLSGCLRSRKNAGTLDDGRRRDLLEPPHGVDDDRPPWDLAEG
jgi:hypothetical protein